LTARIGPERLFHVQRRLLGFFALDGTPRPAPARPFLVSGIARPERFESDVDSLVAERAGHARFPDHHPYTAPEWRVLLERARAADADAVVTTAKDAVRLPREAAAPPVLVLRIEAQIADEARFRARLLAAAERAA
jgi:tetraacyldisaccharide 4'-kinase